MVFNSRTSEGMVSKLNHSATKYNLPGEETFPTGVLIQLHRNVTETEFIIGSILSNDRYACNKPRCSGITFARLSELKRHIKTQHIKAEIFWCNYAGCRRSRTSRAEDGKPFSRKDKRNEHERSVHKKKNQANERPSQRHFF